MNEAPLQISRYPNRRFYARHASRYVSLQEIEEMIQRGERVEIRDSQTGEDLTRSVLAQMIIKQRPEKMSLFPTDMLHFILRSNDVMAGFLRDYFRQSLAYLDYLQRHGATGAALTPPMHWMSAWLDRYKSPAANSSSTSAEDRAAQLAERVEELEARIRQLERQQAEDEIEEENY